MNQLDRYSDFIVEEVGLDGQVAKLTDQIMMEDLLTVAQVKEESVDHSNITEKLKSALGEILEAHQIEEIVKLSTDLEAEFLTGPIASKDHRTLIHSTIRQVFGGKLVSDTVQEQVRIAMKSSASTTLTNKRVKTDKRNYQDPNKLPFVKFVLHKENVDTMEAIQQMAQRLCLNTKDFSYAGTKDRRAITRQFVVARFVNPAKIAGINKTSNSAGAKNLRVSNLTKADGPLRLGDLQGNRFTLILRDLKGETKDIEEALSSLKEHGFVNFFGLQRFGTSSLGSHHLGEMLLKEQWQQAIDAILGDREGETDEAAIAARAHWKQTGDALASHDLFPRRYNAERQILWHFHKQENTTDLIGAILSISRELRLMYVHAFQSAVWNRLATRRIAEFGLRPVVGDLVQTNGSIICIDDSNIQDYAVSDVVLPLPGHETKYPEGVLKPMIEEVVHNEFGITEQAGLAFKPANKALWDLSGAYRKLIIKPTEMEWTVGYLDNMESVIEPESPLSQEGELRCLKMSISLPSSSYATMALREAMQVISSK